MYILTFEITGKLTPHKPDTNSYYDHVYNDELKEVKDFVENLLYALDFQIELDYQTATHEEQPHFSDAFAHFCIRLEKNIKQAQNLYPMTKIVESVSQLLNNSHLAYDVLFFPIYG